MADRINARLPPELERKLALVQARTRKSITAIVIDSLQRYCDEVLGGEDAPYERLVSSGLVGCAEGPEDLSETYKTELKRSLDKKT